MSKSYQFVKLARAVQTTTWFSDVNATYLYVWLCLNADEKGKVVTSYRQLSKQTGLPLQQLRTALKKLSGTKVITQGAPQGAPQEPAKEPTQKATQEPTQKATQGASVITVCYLDSSNGGKFTANTSSNTRANTSSNTSTKEEKEKNQKKKIENVSIEENIKNPPAYTNVYASPQGDAPANFKNWLKEHCPYIYEHLELPTEKEFLKLRLQYTAKEIAEECEQIENRVDLRKKYKKLYLTLLNWLKRRKERENNNGGHHTDNQTAARAIGEAAILDVLNGG